MKVKIMKLDQRAELPNRATSGSGGFDLVGITRSVDAESNTAVYGTGLSFEIPEGYVVYIYSRSGHGFKENTRLANAVGIVDSDFRGEVKVKLTRDDGKNDFPFVGERIAQCILQRLTKFEIEEAFELNETERGEGGFGSSGK